MHAELLAEHGGLPGPARQKSLQWLNGSELLAGEPEAVDRMRTLAAGELSEEALVAWISVNSR
jgi:prophage maintenance system killer protein